MPSLSLISISKSFSGTEVLKDISVEVKEGELVVILGPSGCGKSTLLRLIAGLEDVDKGEIYIGQDRVDNIAPRHRNVALVFQNYALYPHMTVEKNLAFPLKIAKMSRSEIREKVKQTAELLGLSDRIKNYPGQLSGGQRQRVALGRAIIREPDLFLLDEPLSNLDADLRTRMRREIVSLQKKLGVTTVHVTHDQVEALTMADRIIVLDSGKIRQIGTVNEIYRQPADLFVASFVGTPKINLVNGWVSEGLIKPFGISTVFIPSQYELREFLVGVRPEDIFIRDNGQYSGIINSIEFLGDRSVLTVEYLDNILTILTEPSQYSAGQEIRFDIPAEKVHIFDKNSGLCFTS